MPAFTLYGSRGSTNTDRVRLTLVEAGFTDYELVLLNLQKGEQKVRAVFSQKTLRLLLA
jgi:glutathione S-transferase